MNSDTEIQADKRYDVAVIGGGPAGLSAALMLGRARRSALVIDSGVPRNAPAAHMHGFPSQDGTAPAEFLASTKEQLSTYDVSTTTGHVEAVQQTADGFDLVLVGGEGFRARRVLACTSIVDEIPDIPGLRSHWGRDAVHCPYCHGWEIRDQRIGVLASVPMSIHQALLFRQWSDQITLLMHTQDEPTAEQTEDLAARGIRIVTGEVTRVEGTDGRLAGVQLASGERIDLDALAVAPLSVPRADFLRPLGIEPRPHLSGMGEHVPADETGRTSVEGVWVAGNITNPALNVLGSANAGANAAGAINADLIAEETANALRAHRSA